MYIAINKNCYVTQCDIASDFRAQAGLSYLCCLYPDCDQWSPAVTEIGPYIVNYGFQTHGGGALYSPFQSANDLKTVMCDGGYTILAFFGVAPFYTGDGHAVTLDAFDVSPPITESSGVRVMESFSGEHFVAAFDLLKVGILAERNLAGDWHSSIWIDGITCPFDAISDIGGFWVDSQDASSTHFKYRINSTADPSDSAAVYWSDNPWGPARLIGSSARVPIINDPEVPGDETNGWNHAGLSNIDYYNYFLNHGRCA